MKNYILLFIVLLFSFDSYAQNSFDTLTNKKIEQTQPTPDKTLKEKVVVVAYAVEETINIKFGGRKTTYTVSSIDLVDTNELGPYNTRVVKPKYVKLKSKEELPVIDKLLTVPLLTNATVIEPVEVNVVVPNGKLLYIKIKIIENYERVLEKGYNSEEMLQAVADYRFFAGNLVKAARWYTQLFEYCPDELDPVYYFRYSKSLESIGEITKAELMMALYQIKKR